MHKNAMKCNKTQSKWCINKHGASKIIDTFETYQRATVAAWRGPDQILSAMGRSGEGRQQERGLLWLLDSRCRQKGGGHLIWTRYVVALWIRV
jgi:hypothetical protein